MKKELLSILKKYEMHPDFLGDTIEDVNQVGGMDDTVLHIAARNNSLNDALVFLQNGALIDLKGDLGYTPLHYACMFGNIEMVKLLLDNGSDKNIQNEFGENASDLEAEILADGKVILNSRYLIDAINVIEEENLTFGISGKLAPVVIRNEKSNNYTHIIMPLKS